MYGRIQEVLKKYTDLGLQLESSREVMAKN